MNPFIISEDDENIYSKVVNKLQKEIENNKYNNTNNIQPNNPIIDAVNQITIRDAFTFLIITLPFCFISFGCLFQMFYKFFW